jgi:hypothetical protein
VPPSARRGDMIAVDRVPGTGKPTPSSASASCRASSFALTTAARCGAWIAKGPRGPGVSSGAEETIYSTFSAPFHVVFFTGGTSAGAGAAGEEERETGKLKPVAVAVASLLSTQLRRTERGSVAAGMRGTNTVRVLTS